MHDSVRNFFQTDILTVSKHVETATTVDSSAVTADAKVADMTVFAPASVVVEARACMVVLTAVVLDATAAVLAVHAVATVTTAGKVATLTPKDSYRRPSTPLSVAAPLSFAPPWQSPSMAGEARLMSRTKCRLHSPLR